MKIKWDRDGGKLYADDKIFDCTCIVRNELNGRRKLGDPKEVVRAITNGYWGPPYMPRQFPKGTWKILDLEYTMASEFAPIKIRTNATQRVDVWELGATGGYLKPAGYTVVDEGYHLHWSRNSLTTLGCGRVGTDSSTQVVDLAAIINKYLQKGEVVELEVI